MEWLIANLGTIISAFVLSILVFFLIKSTLKSKKNGCGSCSACNGCSGCHTSTDNRKGDVYETK